MKFKISDLPSVTIEKDGLGYKAEERYRLFVDVNDVSLRHSLFADLDKYYIDGGEIEIPIGKPVYYLLKKHNSLEESSENDERYRLRFSKCWICSRKPKKDDKDASAVFFNGEIVCASCKRGLISSASILRNIPVVRFLCSKFAKIK